MYKKYTLCIIYMECSSVHVGRYLIHYIPCWTYLHLLSWVWCVIMANESNYFSLLTDISFSTKYLRLVHSVIHCLFLRRNFDLQNFIHRNLLFSSVKNVNWQRLMGHNCHLFALWWHVYPSSLGRFCYTVPSLV